MSACTFCSCKGYVNTHGEWCTCGHGPSVHRFVDTPLPLSLLGGFARFGHGRLRVRNETPHALDIQAELKDGNLVIVVREVS